MKKLKDAIDEFADIAKALPDNLQVICFELLLKHHLDSLSVPRKTDKAEDSGAKSEQKQPPAEVKTVEESAKGQEDLSNSDLHVKARRFLEKYSLSLEHLNNLFYKEGGTIRPLYEDLKTTRTSEAQIRIALLQSLNKAVETGDFEAQVESVRKECTDRKCYDINNFAGNFKNNKSLFDFDNYTKGTKAVRLSEAGRKELAEVIKELQ